MNNPDTEDELVLKDKYEMELGTEAILTNNLAAVNPNLRRKTQISAK